MTPMSVVFITAINLFMLIPRSQSADCSKRPSLIAIKPDNTTDFTDSIAAAYSSWNSSVRLGFNSYYTSIRNIIYTNTTYKYPADKINALISICQSYNKNNPNAQLVLFKVDFIGWCGNITDFVNCGNATNVTASATSTTTGSTNLCGSTTIVVTSPLRTTLATISPPSTILPTSVAASTVRPSTIQVSTPAVPTILSAAPSTAVPTPSPTASSIAPFTTKSASTPNIITNFPSSVSVTVPILSTISVPSVSTVAVSRVSTSAPSTPALPTTPVPPTSAAPATTFLPTTTILATSPAVTTPTVTLSTLLLSSASPTPGNQCQPQPAFTASVIFDTTDNQISKDTSAGVTCSCTNSLTKAFYQSISDSNPGGSGIAAISVTCNNINDFCMCTESGECFTQNGNTLVSVAIYPFCQSADCHMYAVVNDALDGTSSLKGDRSTSFTSTDQFTDDSLSALKDFPDPVYLKPVAAGCNGCTSLQQPACLGPLV